MNSLKLSRYFQTIAGMTTTFMYSMYHVYRDAVSDLSIARNELYTSSASSNDKSICKVDLVVSSMLGWDYGLDLTIFGFRKGEWQIDSTDLLHFIPAKSRRACFFPDLIVKYKILTSGYAAAKLKAIFIEVFRTLFATEGHARP